MLAVDDVSLPLKRNLCYFLTSPKVHAAPVLGPSRDNPNAPDRLAAMFFGSVLFEDGRFRMWYSGYYTGRNEDAPAEILEQFPESPSNIWQGAICYAESHDGIEWDKPALGQTKFKGNCENNAIALPNMCLCVPHVIREDDEPDPARRYKMAYWFIDQKKYALHPTFRTAVSPDGLHWTVENPRPTELFLEAGGLYKFNGLYILNAHSFSGFIKSEGGAECGRWGIAMVSPDFRTWLQEWGESFVMPEPADPQERGGGEYTQIHQGTAAMNYGNVLVGVTTLWYNRKVFSEIGGDLGLVVSNDGIAFREPVKGHVYISRHDSPSTPVPGKKIETILLQGNGIFNHGDQTYIYHGRWRNAITRNAAEEQITTTDDYCGEVALATLPRDRWGALGLYPDEKSGSVWSAPLVLPEGGCRLSLNADGASGMHVEIGDANFNLIDRFSGSSAGASTEEGGFDCPVAWPAGDIADLAGQPIRLRILIEKKGTADPRLYAVNLEI